MKPVFADTSFYAACLMPRDAHHARAVELSHQNRATIITTEFVVVELLNFFAGTNGRATATHFVRSLRSDPDTIIVAATNQLIERGFDLFAKRPDKEWSLTDCISFVVMEEHGVTEALTSDADFAQAGFRALLHNLHASCADQESGGALRRGLRHRTWGICSSCGLRYPEG